MKLDYKTKQALSTEELLETKTEILSNRKGNIWKENKMLSLYQSKDTISKYARNKNAENKRINKETHIMDEIADISFWVT